MRELLLEESSGATPQAAVASSSVPMVPTENIPILWKSTRNLNRLRDALEAMRSDMESMSSNKVLKRKLRADGKVNGSLVVFLVLYINDVLIIGNDVKMLSDTKAWVSMQFCMKDLSDASYILDIKIYRDRSRRMLGLTQASYIEKS
ncbi:Retrovirus-related Pol polyprotein from transposon TNT 1-94 [Sesamum angolense]|uniref:Retrovirus-related Pol polyprotein from transposon TNT 1-94 n=1 Tax=Sesamum angolense TaxID=2727404 RepID=A0AAE1X9S1_9LAMI|nr:Retrovirus-related Pol polyprotein from transposon TNT 1-94 [Sesamum angolense]